MDNFKRFSDKKLPDEKCFYTSVKDGATDSNGEKLDGHTSDEDYLTCSKIWNEFNMKNVGDYHDYYLKNDVMLLADAFEKLIDTCLKFYKLDTCHYFSSSGSSWDAILKITDVKLENILDINMYLFIEKGLRGGISYIAKRYIEANNKYMKNYDPEKPSIYMSHLDIKNFYGWKMSDYLPYGGFKWLENNDNFDINSISEKSPIGYIHEIDLEYPDELHALHNDYPLAPEKLATSYDMKSDYCKKIADEYGRRIWDKSW